MYIERFNELAKTQAGFGVDDSLKLWLPIEGDKSCDVKRAIQVIRKSLKMVGFRPESMVGKCFQTVTVSSHALLEDGIKHTVTIGNVNVNRSPYYPTSKLIIEEEMIKGFVPNEVANAHAWFTLEDGTIIDITILSSLARKNKQKFPKFVKAIYSSQEDYPYQLEYFPYSLGIEYLTRVTTEPSEIKLQAVFKWVKKMESVLRA